jgi:hypothetical protein
LVSKSKLASAALKADPKKKILGIRISQLVLTGLAELQKSDALDRRPPLRVLRCRTMCGFLPRKQGEHFIRLV